MVAYAICYTGWICKKNIILFWLLMYYEIDGYLATKSVVY